MDMQDSTITVPEEQWKTELRPIMDEYNPDTEGWGDTDIFDFAQEKVLPAAKKYPDVQVLVDLVRYAEAEESWDGGDVTDLLMAIEDAL